MVLHLPHHHHHYFGFHKFAHEILTANTIISFRRSTKCSSFRIATILGTQSIHTKSTPTTNELESTKPNIANTTDHASDLGVVPKKKQANRPRGYWKNPEHHRKFFDEISEALNVKNLDDWYDKTVRDVFRLGGRGLLNEYYNDSLIQALKSVYPEHPWEPSRFGKVSRGYWKNIDNQRHFLDRIAVELNIKELNDWYTVTVEQLLARGGSGVLRNYGSSLPLMLQSIYPGHAWDASKFIKVPRGYWNDPNNQRQFLERIAHELGITQLDDWYRVPVREISSRGGTFISSLYGNSLFRALRALYPEHPWDLVKFARVPNGHWKEPANQRQYFDQLASELGIQQLDDWYQFSAEQVMNEAKGAQSLLNEYYNGSLVHALMTIYPEHNWSVSKFSKVPHRFWSDLGNQRKLFDEIGKERLGIQVLDDWYGVSVDAVNDAGGRTVLAQYYNGSLIGALQAIYPEHPWDPAKFDNIPRGTWREPENRRRFFDNLAKELGIERFEDWYAVPADEIRSRHGASGLLLYHGNSVAQALQEIYPEHDWDPAKFNMVPKNYWNSMANQRQFLDRLAKELQLRSLDDWSGVTARDVRHRGGSSLLNKYGGSLLRTLRAVYPEHPWKPWSFVSSSSSNSMDTTTGSDELLREYMVALANELRIQHLDDWYRVSADHIRQFGGLQQYIKNNGGLYMVLKRLHPGHPWDEKRFVHCSSKKSSQRWLRIMLHKLFANREIVEDYLHPDLTFSETKTLMELDIYIPSLSIAFEYHGEQHYRDLHFLPNTNQALENEKVAMCKKLGITLVVIPYWWDRTAEGLVQLIREAKPDINITALEQEASGAK